MKILRDPGVFLGWVDTVNFYQDPKSTFHLIFHLMKHQEIPQVTEQQWLVIFDHRNFFDGCKSSR